MATLPILPSLPEPSPRTQGGKNAAGRYGVVTVLKWQHDNSQADSGRRIARPPRFTAAFTFVETLMVLAVLTLLIAVLLPLLVTATEATRRSVCASNLHQWGVGIQSYRNDHAGRLLATPELVSPGSRYPNLVHGGVDNQEMDAVAMAGYVPGADPLTRSIDGIWQCPSAPPQAVNLYADILAANGSRKVGFHYSYFARVELWTDAATLPDQLTDRLPREGRLLMSDQLFRWQALLGNGAWSYNHGYSDPSWAFPASGEAPRIFGRPDIAGANQLYGDGSAAWKSDDDFDLAAMDALDTTVGYVRGWGGDATFY